MKTGICISSNKEFYERTLKVFLKNVPDDFLKNVRIYIGGCDENTNKDNLHFRKHRSFEMTALISMLEDRQLSLNDQWLLLHDTCHIDNFDLFKDWFYTLPDVTEPTKLTKFGYSNSMGLYPTKFIIENSSEFFKFKNQSKNYYIANEDGWFKGVDDALYSGKFISNYEKKVFPYSDTPRFEERYEGIGLIKYKANCFNHPDNRVYTA